VPARTYASKARKEGRKEGERESKRKGRKDGRTTEMKEARQGGRGIWEIIPLQLLTNHIPPIIDQPYPFNSGPTISLQLLTNHIPSILDQPYPSN
jgi:hypothetical protein